MSGYSVSRVRSMASIEDEAAHLVTTTGAYVSAARLRWLEFDRRWTPTYVVVHAGAQVVGVLPMFAPRVAAWPERLYDPRVTPWGGSDATGWLLVGGRTDLACGFLRDPQLSEADALAAATVAGAEGVQVAAEQSRRMAALFISGPELRYAEPGFGASASRSVVAHTAAMDVPKDEDDYLRRLESSKRSVVRRDWRARDASGLLATVTTWLDVMEPAAEMIAAVSRDHGRPDDPALVKFRLSGWLELSGIEPIAFRVDGPAGLLALCLGWRCRTLLQLCVVGLAPRGTPDRHLAYVEALVYAPLRYAAGHGCERLLLGTGAIAPKRLRGAVTAPLFALVAESA